MSDPVTVDLVDSALAVRARLVLECEGPLNPDTVQWALASIDLGYGGAPVPERIEAHRERVDEWKDALHGAERYIFHPDDHLCGVLVAHDLQPTQWRIVFATYDQADR